MTYKINIERKLHGIMRDNIKNVNRIDTYRYPLTNRRCNNEKQEGGKNNKLFYKESSTLFPVNVFKLSRARELLPQQRTPVNFF
jgi:hypothetical protein